MARGSDKLPSRSSSADVDEFLRKVASAPAPRRAGERGRLIFAMDATASREPTWDRACHIQSEMFLETAALGGLDIQLCAYRGYGEFRCSDWLSTSEALLAEMSSTTCAGGRTQIERVLEHAVAEGRRSRVNALVFVGDCMEEDVDRLAHLAGEMGLLGLPAFVFHEGGDPTAARAFQEIARLSGGAYCRFDTGSAQQLRDLLSAVAVFAAGGRRALEDFGQRRGQLVRQLTHQVRRPPR